MRSLQSWILCALLILVAVSAQAQEEPLRDWTQEVSQGAERRPLILVSDVDDTIKRTHVLSKFDMLLNGIKSTNPFGGMETLYNTWACDDLADDADFNACVDRRATIRSPNRAVIYVSAAPSKLQFFGKRFIRDSQFPEGPFIGRDLEDLPRGKEKFKFETIRDLMKSSPQSDFVLVGDNGEKDVQAYAQVKRWAEANLPGMKVHVFIHQVYAWSKGVKPEPDQTMYATSGDLALEFHKRGWLAERSLLRTFRQMSRASAIDPTNVFPAFLDCRPMLTDDRLLQMPLDLSAEAAYEASAALSYVRENCATGPGLEPDSGSGLL